MSAGTVGAIGGGTGTDTLVLRNVATGASFDLVAPASVNGASIEVIQAEGAPTGALLLLSAAGVAAMGLEKIHFFWYVKKISGLALIGYFAGAAVYLVQYQLFH